MEVIKFLGIGFLALLVILILVYNGLVYKKNQVAQAFAGIDVYLRKRYDLIPNLVAAVKGYVAHERETLESVIAQRERYLAADSGRGNEEAKVQIANLTSDALPVIMARAEAYPELKASDHFMRLQHTLTDIEAHIAAARRFYNSAVTDYNTSIEMFPTVLLAAPLGFKPRTLFRAPDESRGAVQVKLG